jgi:hypothetical protein
MRFYIITKLAGLLVLLSKCYLRKADYDKIWFNFEDTDHTYRITIEHWRKDD